MPATRVAVIGGGYAGLTAAYELAKNGLAPVVYEAARAPGGLAGCVRLGGTYIERYYHHWFNHDDHILDLVNELGLRRHLSREKPIPAISTPMASIGSARRWTSCDSVRSALWIGCVWGGWR